MLPPWLLKPDPTDPYREARHVGYEDEPIELNAGTPYREPFGVTLALEWAERLAESVQMEAFG